MATLKEKLLVPGTRDKVLDDCVVVVDQEVASKSGLTGMGIKAVYATVKALSPSIIRDSMNNLLDDFTGRMEPVYAQFLQAGGTGSLAAFMSARSAEVANALLGITDDRAKRASGTLRKGYEKLRPTGQKHVEEAVPRIGGLLEKYTR